MPVQQHKTRQTTPKTNFSHSKCHTSHSPGTFLPEQQHKNQTKTMPLIPLQPFQMPHHSLTRHTLFVTNIEEKPDKQQCPLPHLSISKNATTLATRHMLHQCSSTKTRQTMPMTHFRIFQMPHRPPPGISFMSQTLGKLMALNVSTGMKVGSQGSHSCQCSKTS